MKNKYLLTILAAGVLTLTSCTGKNKIKEDDIVNNFCFNLLAQAIQVNNNLNLQLDTVKQTLAKMEGDQKLVVDQISLFGKPELHEKIRKAVEVSESREKTYAKLKGDIKAASPEFDSGCTSIGEKLYKSCGEKSKDMKEFDACAGNELPSVQDEAVKIISLASNKAQFDQIIKVEDAPKEE